MPAAGCPHALLSQVQCHGSPHLNWDPLSPGREGFLAGLPDGRGAGGRPRCPHSRRRWGPGMGWERRPLPQSQPEPLLAWSPPGLEEEFPGSYVFKKASGSSPGLLWLLLPLASGPETHTTAERCSRLSCTLHLAAASL